jgi:hypothetical protein
MRRRPPDSRIWFSARTHSPHNTNSYLEFEISISSTYSPTYSPTYAFLHAFLHTFLLDYAISMPPDRRQRASRSPQPPQQTPQVFAAALRAKADRSVTAQSAVDDSVIDNATTIDDLPRITIKGKKYVKRERLNQKRGTYSWVHNHGQLLVEIPREIDSEII